MSGREAGATITGAAGSEPFACVSAAWKAHEGELRGYLRHRLADPDVADDVLQDVFVKAMRQGRGFCTLDKPARLAVPGGAQCRGRPHAHGARP